MKKLMIASTIILTVGVALVLIAGVLRSVGFDTTVFNPATLASAMATIGYLIGALAGVVLAGCTCISIAKGADVKKIMTTSMIIAAVGLVLILTSAVFGTIPSGTWGTGAGSFNPTNTNGLNAALNTVGYMAAVLAGVVLVASGVVSATKKQLGDK